ncbi:hypothetical protein BDZ90DRAFT_233737 [Jaminaea rosea]|uniref:Pre-mRNA-splicing factor CWC26 n=1 Tax=Jaminaea rosea TaxID=1569628 RepID=A0A316UKG6_9BASI|nr:hypothetical protein BDZ90DRAFT_233737 [Jaminaea rosea]PWN25729.1 hypothetical protein BDZ90DRAFT_233737 [Jaminaea rosea]
MPPDPKLQAYLAQHYLSGAKAEAILARSGGAEGERKKKKKRKKVETTDDGLRMRDEEDEWKRRSDDDEDRSDAQVVKDTGAGKFKKAAWSSLGPDGQPVAEPEPAAEEQDEQPQMVDAKGNQVSAEALHKSEAAQASSQAGPSKPRAGLRTKEEVRAERVAREKAEKAAEAEAASRGVEDPDDEEARAARLAQTTVYRDATGRRIDVEAEDKALRLEEQRQRRKERERKDWNRGQRQQAEEAAARAELALVEKEGVARYKTDERMNAQLREVERADDPALAFLTKKRTKGPQLPKYKGPPPPPNRFGIPPGYRWDGVDRSNGFEKRRFEALGSFKRRQQDERAFGTEDM